MEKNRRRDSLFRLFSRRSSQIPTPAVANPQIPDETITSIQSKHASTISYQFKQFFSTQHRPSSPEPLISLDSNLPDRSEAIIGITPGILSYQEVIEEGSDLDETMGWTAPDSWAVVTENKAFSSPTASNHIQLITESEELPDETRIYPSNDTQTQYVKPTVITFGGFDEDIKPKRRVSESINKELGISDMLKQISIDQLFALKVYKPSGRRPSSGLVLEFESSSITLSCPLYTTADECCAVLREKFFSNEKHQLFVLHQGTERLLHPEEKPILLQLQWFLELGYTFRDSLYKLGRESMDYCCKFIYSEIPTNFIIPSNVITSAEDQIEESLSSFPSESTIERIYEELILTSGCIDDSVKLTTREARFPFQNLYMIPVILFRYGTSLEFLDFSKNRMLNLPLDFLQVCPALKHLKISENDCQKSIPHSIKVCKQSLIGLDLSVNNIPDLSPNASIFFCQKLKYLNLEGNQLSDLPTALLKCSQLQIIHLGSNQFTEFPSLLSHLPCLVHLNLSFNFIKVITTETCSTLTELHIKCNLLEKCPDISYFPQLTLLDVRGNSISDMMPLGKHHFLKHLFLDYNSIATIPPNIQLIGLEALSITKNTISQICTIFPKLKHLSLAGSKLSSLPTMLFEHMNDLTQLILDENPLTSLPESISYLTSLQVLSCVNCKLTELPRSLFKLPLLCVDVRGNNLQTLPVEIWNSSKLAILNISSNLLGHWPLPPPDIVSHVINYLETKETYSRRVSVKSQRRPSVASLAHSILGASSVSSFTPGLSATLSTATMNLHYDLSEFIDVEPLSSLGLAGSLRSLYAGENRLRDDSLNALQYLISLSYLNLSYNDLYEIGPSFNSMSYLEELYLSGNQLSSFPEGIESFKHLRSCFMNHNKITNCPSELNMLDESLRELELSHNHLKYNITNWQYDWNWSWNTMLKALWLTGNRKFEISLDKALDHVVLPKDHVNLLDFSALNQLIILDTSHVKLSHLSILSEKRSLKSLNIRKIRFVKTESDLSYPTLDKSLEGQVTIGQSVQGYVKIPQGLGFGSLTCPLLVIDNSSIYGTAECLSRGTSLDAFDSYWIWDLLQLKFLGKPRDVLFAVFDAHQSQAAPLAKFCYDHFASIYANELFKFIPNLTEPFSLPDAMRRAFLHLNQKLSFLELSKAYGASGVVVHYIHEQQRLLVGNCGDAVAILCRDGHPLILSAKHSPWNRAERDRIRRLSANGWVSSEGYLCGKYPYSRSFGYLDALPNMSANPNLTLVELTESDDFLILANGALLKWLDPLTAVDLVRSEREDLMVAAKKLRDIAISFGCKEALQVSLLNLRDKNQTAYPCGPTIDHQYDPLLGPKALSLLKAKSGPLNASNIALMTSPITRRVVSYSSEVTDSALARLGKEIPPPIGNLALVFTDIRNSTTLWEILPASMESSLKLHNALMRRLLRTLGGYEVKVDGDAFMAAFPSVEKALKWCMFAQMQLVDVDWPVDLLESPEGAAIFGPTLKIPDESDDNESRIVAPGSKTLLYRGLTVRMGIHWGTPICELDPITQRMDYFGSVVNKAARISSEAAGGQIFTSKEVYSIFQSFEETTKLSLLDPIFFEIGKRQLKGLESTDFLYVCYPRMLAGRFFLPVGEISGTMISPFQMKQLEDLVVRLEKCIEKGI